MYFIKKSVLIKFEEMQMNRGKFKQQNFDILRENVFCIVIIVLLQLIYGIVIKIQQ